MSNPWTIGKKGELHGEAWNRVEDTRKGRKKKGSMTRKNENQVWSDHNSRDTT
jgi:hypothetical protein